MQKFHKKSGPSLGLASWHCAKMPAPKDGPDFLWNFCIGVACQRSQIHKFTSARILVATGELAIAQNPDFRKS